MFITSQLVKRCSFTNKLVKIKIFVSLLACLLNKPREICFEAPAKAQTKVKKFDPATILATVMHRAGTVT